MPHVGIQRLAARNREEHGAKHGHAADAVRLEIANRVNRIHGANDPWITGDPDDAECANGDEPDDDDWAEETADPMRAVLLNHEQRDEDRNRYRHHIRLEERCGDLKALDGAEHADR